MRNVRIYSPQSLLSNSTIELDSLSAHHVKNVLRMKKGMSVTIFNGKGDVVTGEIVSIAKSITVLLQKILQEDTESSLHTHLGQCISRGDRMDYAIQKATELGVTEITPLFSQRCEVKLEGKRLQKKLDHWRHIAIAACEQSSRNELPIIHMPIKLIEWSLNQTADLQLILNFSSDCDLMSQPKPKSVALLVGSEGGLTDNEVSSIQQTTNFYNISIGKRILRTETAPVVALTLLQHYWGDLTI